MRRACALIVLALAGCGRHEVARARLDRPPPPVTSVGGVTLPRLDDVAREMRVLDESVVAWRARLATDRTAASGLVEKLLMRASVLGDLEDYVEAVQVAEASDSASLRVRVRMRVHRFAEARGLLADVPASQRPGLEAALAQATGSAAQSLPYFERAVAVDASPANLLGLALAEADAGRPEAGLPRMERAWRALRAPTALAVAGFLFQWGRLYEQAGRLGEARDRYELAWRAAPRHHEAATHYAGVLALTGDRDRAIEVLRGELATQAVPHPETLGELARLTHDDEMAAASRAEWERYLAALPEAFAHHASVFGVHGPARADGAQP